MSALLINLITALQVLATPMGPEVPMDRNQRDVVAQVESIAQQASDGAVRRLRLAQRSLRGLESRKNELRVTYNKQLGEVDRLKRSRASWRRDRQLRDQKARSQKTAIALQQIDRTLRSQRSIVSRDRKRVAMAIHNELSRDVVSSSRRNYLKKTLAGLKLTRSKAPRKIAIPDLELDEFADTDELLEQIALIERAERKLISQEKALARRVDHFDHMETLRSKRQRAGELGVFDDDNVRRSIGRVGSSGQRSGTQGEQPDLAGGGAPQSPTSDDGPNSFEGTGGASLDLASVVLADVVDAETQDALRRAHRSSSPQAKAKAAKKARTQVQRQLRGLKFGKTRILRHLKRLQGR